MWGMWGMGLRAVGWGLCGRGPLGRRSYCAAACAPASRRWKVVVSPVHQTLSGGRAREEACLCLRLRLCLSLRRRRGRTRGGPSYSQYSRCPVWLGAGAGAGGGSNARTSAQTKEGTPLE
jgi:hypothetical protein